MSLSWRINCRQWLIPTPQPLINHNNLGNKNNNHTTTRHDIPTYSPQSTQRRGLCTFLFNHALIVNSLLLLDDDGGLTQPIICEQHTVVCLPSSSSNKHLTPTHQSPSNITQWDHTSQPITNNVTHHAHQKTITQTPRAQTHSHTLLYLPPQRLPPHIQPSLVYNDTIAAMNSIVSIKSIQQLTTT